MKKVSAKKVPVKKKGLLDGKIQVVKLEGEYPSEWKSPEDKSNPRDVTSLMASHGFHVARMISGSKSYYLDNHTGNVVVFNANIVTVEDGKVWYGDLDLTVDGPELKQVAEEAGKVFYVLREMDGRFGAENQPAAELAGRAAWDTSKGVPRYGKDYQMFFE